MKMPKTQTAKKLLTALICGGVLTLCGTLHAQINTGSDGSDGTFNPVTDTVINMTDHPNGIYQYTSVNIPNGVTVTFIPNAGNTPVYWLVQSNVVINGTVNLSGQPGYGRQTANSVQGGLGGPGGWIGGNGGPQATSGQGPGGGLTGNSTCTSGANASYATMGAASDCNLVTGATYGNQYLLPLLGGSGGGGSTAYNGVGGGGGGGAILIVSSATILIDGYIISSGGDSGSSGGNYDPAGGGSGGAVRLIAAKLSGLGSISTGGGHGGYNSSNAGYGWIRFDTYENDYGGQLNGSFTQGSQYIIIPAAGQLPQLTVTSVGGVAVSASPTGVLATPDALLSAQQNNPIPIVVSCVNLPLNSQITVSVKPANGAAVTATGSNNTGTLSSSTATVAITIPRGGGLIYATATTAN